jgi:hypothetical protein
MRLLNSCFSVVFFAGEVSSREAWVFVQALLVR